MYVNKYECVVPVGAQQEGCVLHIHTCEASMYVYMYYVCMFTGM